MAEEVKKIVTVETNGAFQTLKEYKTYIDQLKASMLSLDAESQAYKDVAQEVRDAQDNLNQVLSDTKSTTDAAAGSYNALSQEMANLKKEWKNMEVGTQAWEDMAMKINSINDQLKDADAQVGVFSRNVGDYANAFEGAFQKAMEGLGGFGPELGKMGGQVKSLIPVIKTVTKTATLGLSGIKKAIVSTGIGALVVAVGLLLANFDKIVAVFKKMNPAAKKAREETDKLVESNKQLKQHVTDASNEIEFQGKLRSAQGETEEKILQFKKLEYQQLVDEIAAEIKKNQIVQAGLKVRIKGEGDLQKIKGRDAEQYKRIQEEIENLQKDYETYSKKVVSLDQEIQISNAKTAAAARKKEQERAKEEKKRIEEIKAALDKAGDEEIKQLEKKYKEEKALMEKYHEDTTELEEKYQQDLKAIKSKYYLTSDDVSALSASVKRGTQDQLYQNFKQAEDYYKGLVEVGKKYGITATYNNETTQEAIKYYTDLSNSLKEGKISLEDYYKFIVAEPQVIEKLNADLKEYGITVNDEKDLIIATNEAYNKYMDTIHAYGTYVNVNKDSLKLSFESLVNTDELDMAFKALSQAEKELSWYIDMYKQDIKNFLTDTEPFDEAVIKGYIALIKNVEDKKTVLAELNRDIVAQTNENAMQRTLMVDPSFFANNIAATQEMYNARLEILQGYLDAAATMEFESTLARDAYLLSMQDNYNKEVQAKNQQNLRNWMDVAGAISSIADTVASAWEDSINRRVEAGEMSVEAAQGEFEAMKGLQYATTWINTIASVAQIMADSSIPSYWVKVPLAAAQLAAGIAQTVQIANTHYDGGGGTSGAGGSAAAAIPQLSAYQPNYTANATGDSELTNLQNALQETPMRAFVVESDISAKQELQKSRESESRF